MKLPGARVFRYARTHALLALTLTLGACGSEPERPLRVGLLVWPPYEIFFLAEHLGYFGDTPIELVDFSANADLADAFESRTIDAICATTDHYIDELGAHPDARIVMVVDISNGADAVVAQPGFESLESLKGARVGLTPSSLGIYVVARALSRADLTLRDVKLRYIDETDQFRSFTSREIDAVAAFEPTVSELLVAGGARLFDSSEIPGEIVDVLIVHRDLIEGNEAGLQQLVNAYFRARARLLDHPDESAAIVSPREGVPSVNYLRSLGDVILPDLNENRRMLSGVNPPLAATMRGVAQVLHDAGSLSAVPDLAQAIDARFVENASP